MARENAMFLVFDEDNGNMYKLTYEQLVELQTTGEFPEGLEPVKQKESDVHEVETAPEPKKQGKISAFFRGIFGKKTKLEEDEEEIGSESIFEKIEPIIEEEPQKEEVKSDEPDPMDVGSLTFDDLFKDLPPEEYLDEKEPEESPFNRIIKKYVGIAHASTDDQSVVNLQLEILRELTYRLDSKQRMCIHGLVVHVQNITINMLAFADIPPIQRAVVAGFARALSEELISIYDHK